MDPETQSDRILLTMHAEAKNQRFAALPLGARQWEIRDLVAGQGYVLGESIQRAICECVAQILNQTITNNNE